MQTPNLWLIQVGRLAWARSRYEAIGGWRRLWLRLWWRTGAPSLPSVPRTPLPSLLARPSGVMHFAVNGYPLCGASIREKWTQEYEFATCPECRELGERALTSYWINTR